MQETNSKHGRGASAGDDLIRIWVVAAAVAITAGVLLWLLRQ
jgi:hypothetical protein